MILNLRQKSLAAQAIEWDGDNYNEVETFVYERGGELSLNGPTGLELFSNGTGKWIYVCIGDYIIWRQGSLVSIPQDLLWEVYEQTGVIL